MFEAFVAYWFKETRPNYRPAPRGKRGILKRGDKTRQADLEYQRLTGFLGLTLGHRIPVLVECKYVGEGRSLNVKAAAYQVNTAAAHFKSAETVIVTNSVVKDRAKLERQHDVKIYDRERMLTGFQMAGHKDYTNKDLGEQVKQMEKDIQGMCYYKAA